MIYFGIRQSFDTVEQIEDRFSNLSVPVEIALPYYWKIYEPARAHLQKIADKIKKFRIEVLSIHAVQAPITNEEFRIWGKETANFAKLLDTKVITLHPNNANKTPVTQKEALKNLEYLPEFHDQMLFDVKWLIDKYKI